MLVKGNYCILTKLRTESYYDYKYTTDLSKYEVMNSQF